MFATSNPCTKLQHLWLLNSYIEINLFYNLSNYMHTIFREYFLKFMPLIEDELDAIATTVTEQKFEKGTILVKEGTVSVDVFFVLEGVLRAYVLQDGIEKTTNFYTEGNWVISIYGSDEVGPAPHNVEAATDVLVTVGNRLKEDELFKQFPRLETVSRRVMQEFLTEYHLSSVSYMNSTPEERYLKLISNRPELFQSIPQYQIASYIGVRPESLSRIRRRLARGK